MGKDDEVNERLAKRLAWSRLGTEDPLSILDDLQADKKKDEAPAGQPKGKAGDRVKRAIRTCDRLAEAVDRVYSLGPGELQAAAVMQMARQASKLGLSCAAMNNHPREAIRLARLLTRHWCLLGKKERSGATIAIDMVDTQAHPEGEDLICEIAATGDDHLNCAISFSIPDEGMHRSFPGLGRKLAALLDSTTSFKVKRYCCMWLSNGQWRESVPSLRRALRLNQVGVRWLAMSALMEHRPSALANEDVLFLLEDAVSHPLPSAADHGGEQVMDDNYGYTETLLKAVAAEGPAGGEQPLLAIIQGKAGFRYNEFCSLDDRWALMALASGYPDVALPYVDRKLASTRKWSRYHAVEAAGRLPLHQARPRLLAAGSDPAYEVVEEAQELWKRLFKDVLPLDDKAGLYLELLDGPLSDTFDSRLMVLRGESRKARLAMLEVLLDEAPSREALVLIAFALGDDGLLHDVPAGSNLPKKEKEWVRRLVDDFGAQAYDALIWMIERFPRGLPRWERGISGLLQEDAVPVPVRRSLVALAARLINDPSFNGEIVPFALLKHLEVPVDLVERIWEIAFSGDQRYLRCRFEASQSLLRMEPCPELVRRTCGELDDALVRGDLGRVERVLELALRLEVPDAAARALGVMDPQERPAETDVLFGIAHLLRKASALPETWIQRALARPDTTRFAAASRLLSKEEAALPPFRELLEEALSSTELDHASAASAAIELLDSELITPEDPRLDPILASAGPRVRSVLLFWMVYRRVPLARYRSYLLDLLVSSDEMNDSLRDLVRMLEHGRVEGWEDLLRSAHPQVKNDAVRMLVSEVLGLPSEADTYWEIPDPKPEIEEDEDEDEDDGEYEGDGDEDGEGDDRDDKDN